MKKLFKQCCHMETLKHVRHSFELEGPAIMECLKTSFTLHNVEDRRAWGGRLGHAGKARVGWAGLCWAWEDLRALEASADALQRVCVPHFGVPGLEPAGEGWRLSALFDGDNRSSMPSSGIRVHIVFGNFS